MEDCTLRVTNRNQMLNGFPAPKKKVSAFIMYIQSRKADLQANNPAWGMRDIVSYVGKEWNSMSNE